MNDLLPRRPLVLGEAVPSEGMIPFQYEHKGVKVPTTQELLRAIYGEASAGNYERFCKNFAVDNCLDCVVPSGQEIKADDPLDTMMSEYLIRHVNDVDSFDTEAFLSDYKRRNSILDAGSLHGDTTPQIDLPLFAGRRVFLFGRGSLSLFERVYKMPNVSNLRKSQEEVFHIGEAESDGNGLNLYISFSITPLFHPGNKYWFFNYDKADRQKLGFTLSEASGAWDYDWNYDEKKFFFNAESLGNHPS